MIATMPAMARAPKNDDSKTESVRIPRGILRKARIVAAKKDISLIDYLAEVLGPIVDGDHKEALRGFAKEAEQLDKPRPK